MIKATCAATSCQGSESHRCRESPKAASESLRRAVSGRGLDLLLLFGFSQVSAKVLQRAKLLWKTVSHRSCEMPLAALAQAQNPRPVKCPLCRLCPETILWPAFVQGLALCKDDFSRASARRRRLRTLSRGVFMAQLQLRNA